MENKPTGRNVAISSLLTVVRRHFLLSPSVSRNCVHEPRTFTPRTETLKLITPPMVGRIVGHGQRADRDNWPAQFGAGQQVSYDNTINRKMSSKHISNQDNYKRLSEASCFHTYFTLILVVLLTNLLCHPVVSSI